MPARVELECPGDIMQLRYDCMHSEPNARPTAKQIVQRILASPAQHPAAPPQPLQDPALHPHPSGWLGKGVSLGVNGVIDASQLSFARTLQDRPWHMGPGVFGAVRSCICHVIRLPGRDQPWQGPFRSAQFDALRL